MRTRICHFLISFLLLAFPAAAQLQPSFLSLTSADGLCNDFIRCIHQDKTGFLWIGTYDGLCRFDGKTFITYRRDFSTVNSLPSNTILDIAEDNYGRLWLSTGKGICYLEKKTSTIHRVKLCHPEAVYYSYDIAIRDNDLWLSSQTALYHYQLSKDSTPDLKGKFLYPVNLTQYSRERLFIDNDKNVFVTKYGKLLCLKGNKLVPAAFLPANAVVTGMAQDDDENYWICDAARKALVRVNKRLQVTGVLKLPEQVVNSDDQIHELSFVRKGIDGASQILCATYKNGLLIYDPGSNHFSVFRHSVNDRFSLSNDQVNAFCKSSDEILWVGTSYGLSFYDPYQQQLQSISLWRAPDAGDRITDVLRDQYAPNIFWLGTVTRGLARFNISDHSLQLVPLPEGAGQVQYLYQAANQDLFIGTERGLFIKEKNEKTVVAVPGFGQVRSISCMISIAPEKYLVSSFEDGCFLYDRQAGPVKTFTTKEGLFSNRCTYLSASADGNIYVTHIATGISKLDISTGRISNVDLQPFLEEQIDFPATFTYCSLPQGDTLVWLGTGLGLVKYHVKTKSATLIASTTRLKTDNEVWSIIQDHYPFLWLKTTFGIYKFNQQTNSVVSFFALNREHIPAQEGYFRLRAWDHTFSVPAYNSFYLFRSDLAFPEVKSSKVVLLSLKVGGKNVFTTTDTNDLQVTLYPEAPGMELSFASINFRKPEFTTYAYKLDGADKRWFDLGDKTSLSFPGLKPGDYTLTVKATDFEGKDTVEPLRVHIEVKPFFWQRPLFFFLLCIVLFFIFYAAYRYRLKQLHATYKVRQKISKDLHDDIGATVSSIGILSSMAKEQVIDEQKKQQFMERIAKDSKYVSEALSDIVWAINPKNDSLEMIFARLLRYAYELFEARNINYHVSLPEDEIKEIYLNMDSRQHLYLIVKEVINNLIKYSKATEASVVVSYHKTNLTVVISDNGIGFDTESAHGNGLQNIRKRTAELKGQISIESKTGFGTTITLSIPVRKYQKM